MKLGIDFQRIRRSRFVTDTRVGFWGRLALLFLIPLYFTWLMFDPFTRIFLEVNTNEPQFISQTRINDDLTSSFLGEFFQTSLQLGWYQICFENDGALQMGGHIVVNREDRGDVTIQVREVLPSPYTVEYETLNASPFGHADCMKIGSGISGINVGTTTVSIGARVNDLPKDFVKINDTEFRMDFRVDFTQMYLYIKQDWFAFFVKYFVIVTLWLSLILLTRSAWDFLRGSTG